MGKLDGKVAVITGGSSGMAVANYGGTQCHAGRSLSVSRREAPCDFTLYLGEHALDVWPLTGE